jgi:twitching motility protein PilT
MMIERGQYDEAPSLPTARVASGSGLLDQWTTAARSARATDVFLATGASPVARVGDALQPLGDRGPLDAETISRELGVVAPADVRGAWSETGVATFTYSDGMGRVRATLMRDQRGPGAALRLLVGEPPAFERLGIGRDVASWLEGRGLVLVAGPSGVGKTTTLAALVRALGDRQRRVVTIEDTIEIIATSPTVSQRAIGEHVPTVTAGVAAAMREGADAIVVGTISSPEAALAVLEAVTAGHLVLATIAALSTAHAANHLLALVPPDRRDTSVNVLNAAYLGAIGPVVKGGSRTFEVVSGRPG